MKLRTLILAVVSIAVLGGCASFDDFLTGANQVTSTASQNMDQILAAQRQAAQQQNRR